MTRNQLITAVEKAAERDGIRFYTGPVYRINSELKELPALWLHPLKTVDRQGCSEGVVTYEAGIDLIGQCHGGSAQEREKAWQEMEERAAAISRAVAMDERVKSVGDVKITPTENSLTNRGEISVHLEMKVEMPFYNN
jgi:hypothetical protein